MRRIDWKEIRFNVDWFLQEELPYILLAATMLSLIALMAVAGFVSLKVTGMV